MRREMVSMNTVLERKVVSKNFFLKVFLSGDTSKVGMFNFIHIRLGLLVGCHSINSRVFSSS